MLINSDVSSVFKNSKYILIDNDFLGIIYENKDILSEILTLVGDKKLYLHPFIKFEFLRNVFLPQIWKLKEDFILSERFGHIKENSHLKIFSKVFSNALLLSKIYAHQNVGTSSSFVDLTLGSLLMYVKDLAILITGNKKDFPSCVYDILGILNYEAPDGNVRSISVIRFNQSKFDFCNKRLSNLRI